MTLAILLLLLLSSFECEYKKVVMRTLKMWVSKFDDDDCRQLDVIVEFFLAIFHLKREILLTNQSHVCPFAVAVGVNDHLSYLFYTATKNIETIDRGNFVVCARVFDFLLLLPPSPS